jgi:hypothetical protein
MLNGLRSEEFSEVNWMLFLCRTVVGGEVGRGAAGMLQAQKLALLTSIARATRYGELEAQVARSNHSCG